MATKEILIASLRKDHGIDLDQMVKDVHRYIPTFNERKFREAFVFAAKAHEGQFRKENKPYIIHPVEVVRILISMHADEDTLMAAFLHDVPEDTPHPIAEIESKFGKKIAFLVEGVTKLSKVHFRNEMAERQVESLKKLFIHSAEDLRIILIKLADRLHNMRTLQYIDKPEKRLRIARETLEIFVPIANLLGIEELKSELEDLCFRYLFSDEYENLSDRMRRNKDKNEKILDDTIQIVQKNLEQGQVKVAIYGRQKSLYSIYKKIVLQGKRLDEIDDLIALRILVQEREDCYKVLGILHSLFKPKPGKFKDYIAVPKVNGYQSLHTTVFGIRGLVTEFQIRTNQMHLEAEYGIAAHYFYDQQKQKTHQLGQDRRSYWAEKILHMQKEQMANHAFLEDLKLDIFQDRIFVFTPKGDPIDLPKDASCIDFAYIIHTEVGNDALKADVNGDILPMTTILHMGDTVRIITSASPKGPSREWLSFTKTNLAKNRIREFLRHESQEAKIQMGEKLLQKELDRAGLGLVKNIPQKKIRLFLKKLADPAYKDFDDVMVAIGDGTISSLEAMHQLYPIDKLNKAKKPFKIKALTDERGEQEDKMVKHTQAALKIYSEDRVGQLKKILQVAADLGINTLTTKAYLSFWTGKFICKLNLNVQNFSQLSRFFENIEHIEGVLMVKRLFWQRKVTFITASTVTFFIWAVHPFMLHFIAKDFALDHNPLVSNTLLYGGLFLLFLMVLFLKNITQHSFPELRESKAFWLTTFLLNIFAMVTIFAEIYFFQLNFNWVLILGMILLIFSYFVSEYISHYQRSS